MPLAHGPDAFASGIGTVPSGKQKRVRKSPFLVGGESRSRGKPDPCFSKGDAQKVNIPLEKCEILCKVPLEKREDLLHFPLEKCIYLKYEKIINLKAKRMEKL